MIRLVRLFLLVLVASLPSTLEAAAQDPDRAAAAADMVEAILGGDDDSSAWDALNAALDSEESGAPPESQAPPESETPPEARSWLPGAFGSLRDEITRTLGMPEGGEAMLVAAIALLAALGMAALGIGLLRRLATRPRGTTRPARRARRRGPMTASAGRRRRNAACRDAERLEARLRASRAA